MSDKDRIVLPLPLYHCFAMVLGNLMALNYGATVIYPAETFDPAKTLEAVTKYGGTSIYGVPTMFIAMLEELEKNHTNYNLKTLRTGLISGAPCPESLMRKII